MKQYLHIPTMGPCELFEPPKQELPELQRRVGGKIETGGVYCDHLIYVDEEGLFKEGTVNLRASALCGQILVGDAVMVGPVDFEGDTDGVSLDLVDRLREVLDVWGGID